MNRQIKIIIQDVFTKLPWRIQQVLKLVLSYTRELSYPHSDFPLTGKKSLFTIRRSFLDRPILFDNDEHSYYSRIYADSRKKDIDIVEENISKTAVEIIPCDLFKTFSLSIEENVLFQVSCANSFGLINFEITNDLQNQKFELNDNGRFISIMGAAGSKIKIEAKEGVVVSLPIAKKQKVKNKKRLSLFLFVDGLVDRSILGYDNLNEIMPNTAKFFNTGFDFRNHYVNAEWTLPSFASIFSGRYSHNHGLYDPHKIIELGGLSFRTLSQYFKESQYVTFSSGGNGRISPSHGYVKGFDRSIYRSMAPVNEVVANFIEHNHVFHERDQFAFLQFNELHHNLSIVPDFSVMSSLEPSIIASALNPKINTNLKSVFSNKSDDMTVSYIERIRRLDHHLNTLYQYLENSYDMDEVSVCLCSDHGQAYLTDDTFPLSDARTKAVWMLRSGGKIGKEVDELTEGVDIFNSVLSDAGISFDNNIDGQIPLALGGLAKREFTFSHSIYPGQTYKAVINSVDGKYIYETERPVDSDGIINHVNSSVKILSKSNNNKKMFTENQVKELVKMKLAVNN